jgi:hypothetical protein
MRDLFILPLISLVTIVVCVLLADFTARTYFRGERRNSCEVSGPTQPFHYRPNCVAMTKARGGPWVKASYNDCGFRTKEPCGPKPAGSARIAVVGSSMTGGMFVADEDTIGTQTSRALTQALGRPVEVQNLSRDSCYAPCAYRLLDDALALKPDLLIIAINSHDMERVEPGQFAHRNEPLPAIDANPNDRNPATRLNRLLMSSAVGSLATYWYLQDSSNYAKLYLKYGDRADFLRTPATPRWEARYAEYDLLFGDMADKAQAAGVPVVLFEIPSFAQAAVLRMPHRPAGVDPHVFNQRLEQIASRHHAQFVESLDIFNGEPKLSDDFYVVELHQNPKGYRLVAQALVEQLLAKQRPALTGLHPAQQ